MRLFVTYAHQDTERIRGLAEILAAGGHSVWFDDQLLPGQDWKSELAGQIAASDALVYALTQSALDSEWCEWEFATAVRLNKAVIPALMEAGIAMPQSLKRLQYADFREGPTGVAVAKLMGALVLLQKVSRVNSPSPPPEPKGVPSRAWNNLKHWTDNSFSIGSERCHLTSRAWNNLKHWTDAFVPGLHAPQDEAEEIRGKFAANLMRGLLSVGGRIILTNERLLFEAHRLNIVGEPVSIPLSEISSVIMRNTFGMVPNGITVRCHSGESYHFVLWNRQHVITLIERERQPHQLRRSR